MMLMVQSLVAVSRSQVYREHSNVFDNCVRREILSTIFQGVAQILQSQNGDGSWGSKGPREETAYAILALATILELPIYNIMRLLVISAIERSRIP